MCSHSSSSSSANQTLNELEFERGLWTAALDDDLLKCQELVQRGHDPSQPDSSGFTPLHYAVRASKIEIVECLLKSGCEVNAQTKGSKATALHRACMKGRPEIVQLLLKYGCNPNITDEDGRTALHLCNLNSTPGKEDCAKLLSNVTDSTITDKDGKLPHS